MESEKSLQKVAPEKFHEKIFQELKELEEQKWLWSCWDTSTSWENWRGNGIEPGCCRGGSRPGQKVISLLTQVVFVLFLLDVVGA